MKLKAEDRPHIMVLGSASMELAATARALPAAGETIVGDRLDFLVGGQGGMLALALAALKARVFLLSCVGSDIYGSRVAVDLKKSKVNTDYLQRAPDVATALAHLIRDREGRSLRVLSPGANMQLKKEGVLAAKTMFTTLHLLAVQMDMSEEAIETALLLAKRNRVPVLINPSPVDRFQREWLKRADILVLNRFEAETLLERRLRGADDLIYAVGRLLAEGVGAVAVTAGEWGAAAGIEQNDIRYFPAPTVSTRSRRGVGAAFTAALSVALAKGMDFHDACALACRAGALCAAADLHSCGFDSFEALERAGELELET